MNEQNLSQWFDLAEQKPWEVGVYQVEGDCWPSEDCWSYFDGNGFNYKSYTSAGHAFSMRERIGSGHRVKKWRGLSSNPEVKKKPSGNKKVTKYVVMSHYCRDTRSQSVAVFSSLKLAQSRAEEVKKTIGSEYDVWVSLTRFRTPE